MWLTTAESERVCRADGPLVLWRWKRELLRTEVGSCYQTGGCAYTVADVRAMTRADVRKNESQKTRAAVWDEWAEYPDFETVWKITVRPGDFGDKPRYMQPTGSAGGDYTTNPQRAMRDEAEALSAQELSRLKN